MRNALWWYSGWHRKYNFAAYHIVVSLNQSLLAVQQLAATGQFSWVDQYGDEQEHSLELHMPYIAKTLPGILNLYVILYV